MKEKIGSALVVGAGISGIRSALDLAETGYRVTLVDRAPNLGGTLSQLDSQFPSDHCGMCRMLPMVDRDCASEFCLRKGLFHENIDILLSTEMVALTGEPGDYRVTLRGRPVLVDPERCMGCGKCAEVCPVEVPDEFNAGLSKRKAVYLPVPHNIPNRYVVDIDSCARCGLCEKACPTGAIDLRLEARGQFRILVVESEPAVRGSIEERLKGEGYLVDTAESWPEAFQKLKEGECGLILLDVDAPEMDEIEAIKAAREIHPDLPVISMTANETAETQVEARKAGHPQRLTKPIDVENLLAGVFRVYCGARKGLERELEVGAVVLAAGFESFDPAQAQDTYGYGAYPNVVTSVEFERLISGTGPTGGELKRPSDGKPVRRIAWLQCVGSRNLQLNADYCSTACCMFSVKEALLAKEKSGGAIDTAIFYMDMRTFGKDFQQYRNRAELEQGVRFIRSRAHSVEPENAEGDLRVSYSDVSGEMRYEFFDMAVLAAGQKPPKGAQALAESAGIELNPWGFCKTGDFSLTRTSRDGIVVSGSFSGLRDISESVVQAGSAALAASSVIHAKGGGLARVDAVEPSYRDVSRELPRIAVVLCSCGGALAGATDLPALTGSLEKNASVARVIHVERLCVESGWNELKEKIEGGRINRILIGACMPYVYGRKLKELGRAVGLNPSLLEVVDIRTAFFPGEDAAGRGPEEQIRAILDMGIAKLEGADPSPPSYAPNIKKALVVGGGIAGMTAALSVADHGFEVSLIERSPELGGNIRKIHRTIEGHSPGALLDQTLAAVQKHPLIHVYKSALVIHSEGEVGAFRTTIEKEDGGAELIDHGVTILATGGLEAATQSYAYGKSDSILTQRELEEKLHTGAVDPGAIRSVVMIQCVDSREKGREYCSRVCCSSALKNALHLKEKNPDADIYIFYRDVMTYGFLETYYTQARRAGVIFIRFEPDEKPEVTVENGAVRVSALDPILGRRIILGPDLLALSTGMTPSDGAARQAEVFGVETNEDGFFQEAESKWRPVELMKQGVFTCGIAHSPRSIVESVAMAEAAAQHAIGLLCRDRLPSARVVAEVRHSLCSLCERCIAACPFGARRRDEDEERIVVNETVCMGCGACAVACPNSASIVRGFGDRQMFAVLDAALDDAGGWK